MRGACCEGHIGAAHMLLRAIWEACVVGFMPEVLLGESVFRPRLSAHISQL